MCNLSRVPARAHTGASRAGGVLKMGWLEKRGELNTAYKQRYFVLRAENPYKDVPMSEKEQTERAGANLCQESRACPVRVSTQIS